ncbi:14401_t:CDS:2 [Entrophospora sp. SA101]|nr:14401_t:CDS:2 [Entrophospora sp. SA101]
MSETKMKNIILLLLLLSLVTIVNSIFLQKIHPQEYSLQLDNNAFTVSRTITDCSKSEDILQIEYINLKPDPPAKGKPLFVDAAGFLKETILNGSYVDVVVKLGSVNIFDERMDLCEKSAEYAEINCPIKKGHRELHREFEIPNAILPGTYIADINAYTSDGRKILCLKVTVTFRFYSRNCLAYN